MQYIKIFLSTGFTVVAFMFNRIDNLNQPLVFQLVNLAYQGDVFNITWCALALFIFAFYWRSWQRFKGFVKIEAIFSLLLSVLTLIGRSFSACDSLQMLTEQKLLTLFALIGWSVFFYMLLRWVSYFVEGEHMSIEKFGGHQKIQLTVFAFMLLCWLPYWFFCLPGNVLADAMSQLCQWFGYAAPSDHHPWIVTAFLGFLMSIGKNISDNAGIIVIVLFQFIFCAWAYSQVCLSVAKYAGKKASYLAWVFFAILPVWGIYAATVVKDTLAIAIFALYFCCFIDIFEEKKTDEKKWLKFGILSLLVCLSRHEGIYTVLFAGAALFLGLRAGKRQLAYVLIGICICMAVHNILIFNVLGISKGSVKEMLSIPFQQTARYSRDHTEDISEEEKNVIDKVLPYDELASIYDPNLSDPVKGRMKKAKKEDLKEYFRVWFNMGLRHPGTYLQATINNSYRYCYPFYRAREGALIYISEEANKGLNIYYLETSLKKRQVLWNYYAAWCAMPGISLLSSPGAYTWVVLIGIMLLLKRKKYRELIVFIPLIVRIAICCASPVNGLMRYAMPLVACTPVLLAWLAHTLCSESGDDNG